MILLVLRFARLAQSRAPDSKVFITIHTAHCPIDRFTASSVRTLYSFDLHRKLPSNNFLPKPSHSVPFCSHITIPVSTDSSLISRRHFSTSTGEIKADSIMCSDMTTFKYPEVERDDSFKEKIFDVDVQDPYRYFEDPHSEKTKQFIAAQNAITEPYIKKCQFRSKIEEILRANQDYEKIDCRFKRGKNYYYFYNSGLQPHAVLYKQATLESEATVFFDPNTLSEDGTVSLATHSFSEDGEYFAYGISHSGSDWVEIGVRHVETGKDLEEKLTKAKFTSLTWTHDNKGFFYARYPSDKENVEGTDTKKLKNHSVYYHTLNTKQTEDPLKVDFPSQPDWNIGFEVSQDGNYFFVYPREGCHGNAWLYCDLRSFSTKDKLITKPVYEKMDAEIEYIANNGDTIYFRTNLDAQNYRIVKLDLKNPGQESWVDVIPSDKDSVLEWAEVYTVGGQDYILVNFLRKVVFYLELHKLEGEIVKKFDLPAGTIGKYSGRRNHDEIFFQFTSFLTPGQTYRFDLNRLDTDPKLLVQVKPKNFDPTQYTIEQVFYQSADKTEVPMFIIHRKDLVKDGNNPCLLYGYGGFNHSITSSFSINRIAWLKNFKGIYAVANIRGGGELGQSWYDSGRLLNKQNCFTDFIAAAEHLINNKYTSSNRLAIQGGSNGGLLVAAVSNQRPDLFGANICHVGVLDMIRYSDFTIGHLWKTDYGDPKEKKHFENLIKFSPYHNIPSTTERYPATLLLTADHDDRVVPAHSLKFIAQLQHKLGKKLPQTPLLIRVDTKAGHGAGKPISKVIDETADIYAFLYTALDLKDYYNDE